jgi:hypothetical protein
MPPPGPNGEVDPSRAPDFIAVAGRDGGIAGYVPKRFLFRDAATGNGLPLEPDYPVYGDDLRTLVGHMVAGKGFVPLGVDPRAIPNVPVQQGPSLAAPVGPSRSVTLYVRNGVAQMAWFAVLSGGKLIGGQGYNGLGVGCIDVAVGDRLVLLDRAPQESGAVTIQTIYARPGVGDPPTLWVDIAADGIVGHGDGTPAWWPGAAQPC